MHTVCPYGTGRNYPQPRMHLQVSLALSPCWEINNKGESLYVVCTACRCLSLALPNLGLLKFLVVVQPPYKKTTLNGRGGQEAQAGGCVGQGLRGQAVLKYGMEGALKT